MNSQHFLVRLPAWHSIYVKLCISVNHALWCCIRDFEVLERVQWSSSISSSLIRAGVTSWIAVTWCHTWFGLLFWCATASEHQTKLFFSLSWSLMGWQETLELEFVRGKLEAKCSFSPQSRPALSRSEKWLPFSTILITFHNGSLSGHLFMTKFSAICQSGGQWRF